MDGLVLACRDYFPAAVGLPGPAASPVVIGLPADPPTPTFLLQSNIDYAALTFPDASDCYGEFATRLPADWFVAGGLALHLFWSTPATSGSARWVIQTAFVDDDGDLNPSLNAEQAIVTAAGASANTRRRTEFAALDLTGAAAGAHLMLVIARTPTHGDDDLGDDANLIGFELLYQRLMVLP